MKKRKQLILRTRLQVEALRGPLVPTGPVLPQMQADRHLRGSEQRALGAPLQPALALPVAPCSPSRDLSISAFRVPSTRPDPQRALGSAAQ